MRGKLPKRVARNRAFLKKLFVSKSVTKILRSASDDEILTIVEICYNIMRFRFNLSQTEKDSLRQVAGQIFDLSELRERQAAEKLLLDYSFPRTFYSRLLAPFNLK